MHERNVEELMLAALPFHETEQFVRLVQILRLPPRGRFAFLEPMQASGAPAPRNVIVLRCVTDRVRPEGPGLGVPGRGRPLGRAAGLAVRALPGQAAGAAS